MNEKKIGLSTSTDLDDLINIASGEKAVSLEVVNARDLGLLAIWKAEESEEEEAPNAFHQI